MWKSVSTPASFRAGLEIPRDVGADEAVLLGEEAEHRCLQRGQHRLHVRVDAVEVHARPDRFVAARTEQRELPAHAEAHDADSIALRTLGEEEVARAAEILLRLLDVERHHELAGVVRGGRRLAVVEVGGERHVALRGEAVGDVLDVADEPPPLLDHDDAGTGAALGARKISLGGTAVRGELDHRAFACRHGRDDTNRPQRIKSPTFLRSWDRSGAREPDSFLSPGFPIAPEFATMQPGGCEKELPFRPFWRNTALRSMLAQSLAVCP